jgi:hypothetical protein
VAKNLSEKLLSKITTHPNIKASKPAVRNAVSAIRRKNPGVTLNAAAFIYAEKHHFKVWQQLDSEDRLSLQYRKETTSAKREAQELTLTRRSARLKEVTPAYGADFHREANANASIYPYIFILENSLRQVILDSFKTEASWWNNTDFVKEDIRLYSERIQKAERDHPWSKKRGEHPIYYVGLNELLGIITKNWERFKGIFKDQGNLRTWFNELIPVRNLVAHNVPTTREEAKIAELRTYSICTTIENSRRTQH